MSRMSFLTARAWLDDDGRHVWLAHDCTNGRETVMLPTMWKADSTGRVEPSIDCKACGSHFFAQIEPRPEFSS